MHVLDLRPGLSAAAAEIDAIQPAALELRWGSLLVGIVPPRAGAEPLQGRHLRSLLRDKFAAQFRAALALADGQREVPATPALRGAAPVGHPRSAT
jgi:hypothetical protein